MFWFVLTRISEKHSQQRADKVACKFGSVKNVPGRSITNGN